MENGTITENIKQVPKWVYMGLMILARLSPFLLTFMFCLIFILTLNTRFLLIVGIIIGNIIVNSIFKYIIRGIYQKYNRTSMRILGRGYRPKGHGDCSVFVGGVTGAQQFGMPSGHSQIIWSIIAYLIVYLYYENKNKENFEIYYPFHVICLVIIGIFVSYSRVTLSCHTPQQVIIGGIIGAGIGLGMYYLVPDLPVLQK